MSALVNQTRAGIAARTTAALIALATLSVAAPAQTDAGKRPENRPPTVVLRASPTSLCYGGVVKLTAVANDPDGDKLTYRYKADGGRIVGEGRKVRWVSGEHFGPYGIRVDVTDGHGGAAYSYVSIMAWELCGCPSLVMDAWASDKKPLVKFLVNVLPNMRPVKPAYSWSVSAGKIVKGRGTFVITVDSSGVEAGEITATVSIGGLAPECDNTRSFTVKNPFAPSP